MASYLVAGKSILITGAARGIGAETARRLAAKGAKLSLVGLEPEELEKVAAQCGRDAVWFEADVTDWDALERAASGTVDAFGGIDVVMANAGVAVAGLFAPGVALQGQMYIYDINANGTATPVILIGSGPTTQINGGDLFQTNGRAVQVSGLTRLVFVNGSNSGGTIFPAQMCQGRLEQNGADVTAQIVVNPN